MKRMRFGKGDAAKFVGGVGGAAFNMREIFALLSEVLQKVKPWFPQNR